MVPKRRAYEYRAKKVAAVTIPALFPPEGHDGEDTLRTPYQSVGARGVNNLSSKLLLTLLSSTAPFFRMRVDPSSEQALEANKSFKTEIETAFSRYERTVMEDVEAKGDRVVVFETLKHLIVAGNALMYQSPEGLKLFRLNRYVTRRDPMGTPLEIAVKETFEPASLPENVREIVSGIASVASAVPSDKPGNKTIDVYTHIMRKAKQWFVYQEVKGIRIPGSESQFPLDKTSWHALRLTRVDGEDYGRGYAEEYLGDLNSLEGLSKAIVEGAAAAAKVLFLVKPNGTTRAKTLATAPNAAIREGNADDVTVLQVNKFADFRTARETMSKIEDRLQFAFLVTAAIQRDAERVTAEEIRLMAQELDAGLGGVFSILTQEFQLPYVRRKIAMLERKGVLPRLPKDKVRVVIVTGLEALGRSQDGNRLITFLRTLSETLGPEVMQKRINVGEAVARLALSEGIDTNGLIRSDDEVAALEQQAQQQQLIQTAAPQAVAAGGKLLV